MSANQSYLRVYFMGRFNSKVIIQKCVFFTNIRNNYSVKIKKLLSIMRRLRIKWIYIEDFVWRKVWKAHHTSCNWKLIISYSIPRITQLLSEGLKKDLHLLSVSEMGKFQTKSLNFGG